MFKLVDFVTGEEVRPSDLIFTGTDHPWEVRMNLSKLKTSFDNKTFKQEATLLSKFHRFLPLPKQASLLHWQESPTPLVKSRYLGEKLNCELYFKLEGKNPTGSFKDRGSMIEMTIAKHHHAKKIVVASTGNMAASCACYAALVNIPCLVFVPSHTPDAKLTQVRAFGGEIHTVDGDYAQAAKAAFHYARTHHCYLAGDYAFRLEGQKTAVFELIDQLHFHMPNQIIVPMGCGTNIAAYYKGMMEYQTLGLIKSLAQLVGVQSEGANPIVKSFSQHLQAVKPSKESHTIASAIAVSHPIDGLKALQALYKTAGLAISVSDRAIKKARRLLAEKEGLFVETASAASVACLFKLYKKNKLGKKVICILTGEGLKDSQPL